MKRHFKLSDYSVTYSTRARADEIVNNLEQFANTLDYEDHLVIDFTGVEAMSYSFLDQFIGRLREVLLVKERRVSIYGWSDSLVTVIDRSLEHRNCSYSQSGIHSERVLVC